jgi:heme iron utilization protein
MNTELTSRLRLLLNEQSIAALGTLHNGAPCVSMTPFALIDGVLGLVIHVSGLASHTKDMETDCRVSLLVADVRRPGVAAQALPRVTFLGQARMIPAGSPEHTAAKAAYLLRFPDAARIFALPDFRLMLVIPSEARFVAGFGQAVTINAEKLTQLLAK